MIRTIKILWIIILLNSYLLNANDIDESIGFSVNECTLAIPSNYDIAITDDLKMNFFPSIYYALQKGETIKNDVRFSLGLTETDAYKIVMNDLNRTQPNDIKDITKDGNLVLIDFVDNNYVYIVGKRFYISTSRKDSNGTKQLIQQCNETWKNNLFIKKLDLLVDKIIKDFPYTPPIALNKEKAILVQKKLEKIYEDALK